MQTIKFKRATRAQIDAAATSGNLKLGEPYAITDEGRLAIGESTGAYTAFLKAGEGAAAGEVATPTNASPADNAVDVVPPLVISAGAFSSTGAAPHSTARYQLSTINNFTLPDYDSGELAPASSYAIDAGIVGFGESVYWRIQFIDALGILSDWSTPTKFESRGVSVVTKPANTLPADGATDTKRSRPLTGSAFVSTQGALHQATRLQIGSSVAFTAPRIDVTLGAVTQYKIPKADFLLDTAEYWRIQYQNDLGIWSEWSDATRYTTAVSAGDYIDTPAPTPANFGAAFEGGFYAGMIWNQIAQSADSKKLATGTHTFTVPDMSITPLTYEDQQLEIRSRANPDNHFKCVVTYASGADLEVNVTAISGSGTFSDWSILSRFRNIVSPKAGGEVLGISLMGASAVLLPECSTPSEGFQATNAMYLAGTAAKYPAAHACHVMSMGGFNDWHVPARDQWTQIWRVFKPSAAANFLYEGAPLISPTRLGEYPDITSAGSFSKNTSPVQPAYTMSDPVQTSISAFRVGAAQAIVNTTHVITCSAPSSLTAMHCEDGVSGAVSYIGVTESKNLRAVRRSII